MAGLSSSDFQKIAALANTGLCGRELREALSVQHGIKLNRNQIGGILFRLRAANKVTVRPDKRFGSSARRRSAEPPHPSKSVPRPAFRMPMLGGRSARFAPSPVFNQPETAPAALPPLEPIVERGPANIFDLAFDSCRWPLWPWNDASPIEAKLYCNEAQHGEGPYCCTHLRASQNPNHHPVSIRKAANVKKTHID